MARNSSFSVISIYDNGQEYLEILMNEIVKRPDIDKSDHNIDQPIMTNGLKMYMY